MNITPNRLVTIKRPPTTQDATYGTPSGDWTAVLSRAPAEVRDSMPSRAESLKQGLQIAANQARIRMRWRDDIDSTMRVTVHGGTDTVYQIIGGPAMIGQRKQYMEIMCEKYSTDGNSA